MKDVNVINVFQTKDETQMKKVITQKMKRIINNALNQRMLKNNT